MKSFMAFMGKVAFFTSVNIVIAFILDSIFMSNSDNSQEAFMSCMFTALIFTCGLALITYEVSEHRKNNQDNTESF